MADEEETWENSDPDWNEEVIDRTIENLNQCFGFGSDITKTNSKEIDFKRIRIFRMKIRSNAFYFDIDILSIPTFCF